LFSRRTRKNSNAAAAAAGTAAAAINVGSMSRANNNSDRELKDRLINTIKTSNKGALNNTIKDILHRGLSVNFYDDGGFTPLLRAIDKRNSAAVLTLLLCGADKGQASKSGVTPSRRIDDNTDDDATAYSEGGPGDTPAMNDVRCVFEESESIFKSYREYCTMVSKPHMMKRAISELVATGKPALPHGFSKVLTQYSKNRNTKNASSFATYFKFKYVMFLLYTYGCPGLSLTTLTKEINSLIQDPRYRYLAREARDYIRMYGSSSGDRVHNTGTRGRSRSRSRSGSR
jgi:hypothetical protein